MQDCINCNKSTSNPKFCSRSCAATYTNKLAPKRKVIRICVKCPNPIKNHRTTFCIEHYEENKNKKLQYELLTIGSYRNKQSVKKSHCSSKHAHIRNLGRSWNKHLLKLPCANCGYDKHVEIAHIIPIADFPDHALLEEVHHPNNLVQLCPNCHWEFDNGLIDLNIPKELRTYSGSL